MLLELNEQQFTTESQYLLELLASQDPIIRMPRQFANTQPAGFSNYIHKVAIVGASGHQGSYIVDLLLKTGKHKVTAITREDSTSIFPEGVETKKVNYDSNESIAAGLKGQDALIITISVRAPQENVTKLIEAAAAADVKWVIPNEWGA